MQLELLNDQGQATSKYDAPETVFGRAYNEDLVHQVVVAFQANARQGTRAQKDREQVKHSTKKPFKQKGTGNARQGSSRSPNQIGGGTAHAVRPRKYGQRTPKKMIAAALRGVLSDRQRNDRIHVLDSVSTAASTKAALAAVRQFSDRKNLLVIVSRNEDLAWRSLRNADDLHLLVPDQLNAYDILKSDDMVFSESAIKDFLAGPAKGKSATAVARESEVEVSA